MGRISDVGMGAWQHSESDECAEGVRLALDGLGYRHVDTAGVYVNRPDAPWNR